MTELREFQDNEVIAGTRYRVLHLIGVGGMGSVYEVEHTELGKRFVLKALLRELVQREDLAQRLRNEWRALARLEHPNIVNVTDAGTSKNGVPFYVMERLEGVTLAVLLRQKRRLYVLDAVSIAAAVLDALSAAHDIGIIHRDVKPANVFVVQGGGVKLLDFGIAKIADANSVVTARGLAVGTPRYMSPEQARGERVDGRSDVYAAALILFEMIAGVGPFDDARDANELLLAHLAREAPALSSVVAGVSPDLEQILKRMLAKDCRRRPARARDCAAELRHFAARQHTAPATDALTARAHYGAPTVAAATPSATTRGHDPTTRLEGVARRSLPPPTDTALTQRLFLSGESTQVTLSASSSEPHSVSGIPNTTFVAPPPFEVKSTLDTSAGRHPESLQALSRHTLPLPSFPGVERPERTEMLGEFTPAPPSDAAPTNTRVPLPEVAPPISVTPPPVVDNAQNRVSPAGRRSRLTLWAALAAASLSALLLAGFVARQTARASDSLKAQAAAPATLPAAAALLLAPSASPVTAPVSAAAPGLALTPAPTSALAPGLALAPAPSSASTLGSAPVTAPAASRLSVASVVTARVRAATPPALARGPLLRAAAAARPVAPPARRDPPPMPSSGL